MFGCSSAGVSIGDSRPIGVASAVADSVPRHRGRRDMTMLMSEWTEQRVREYILAVEGVSVKVYSKSGRFVAECILDDRVWGRAAYEVEPVAEKVKPSTKTKVGEVVLTMLKERLNPVRETFEESGLFIEWKLITPDIYVIREAVYAVEKGILDA